MKKITEILHYFVLATSAVVILASCAKDNYDGPEETFRGAFIDKGTGETIQTAAGTAIEHGGIRIRMMEYSWSDNPTPYDFFAKQDGTFNNTKIFKGTYGVIPEGPFVPLEEIRLDIDGVVEHDFQVEPFLRIEWVGEPVMKDNGTVEVTVKITRGTDNPEYQRDLAEAWLYVNHIQYVSGDSYSNQLSTHLTGEDLANYELGEELTITTGYPGGWSGAAAGNEPIKFDQSFERTYFLRFAARTSQSNSGITRYNYTDVKPFLVPKE